MSADPVERVRRRARRTSGRVGRAWAFAYFLLGLQVFSLALGTHGDDALKYLALLGFSLFLYVLRHEPNLAKVAGVVVFFTGARMIALGEGAQNWLVGLAAIVGLVVALLPSWPQPEPWVRSVRAPAPDESKG
ncbi:hypothetical protein JOF53_004769 [Crossiella equi]|uniref:Uncharacterized protein n=1 Tax=Crossiella equi TaxID=130796 RepID=A0ABS5AH52_9PSEU|nr:hypothetical protein [Crossiella equi]MBP2475897.1 hypothetical protein [Crossiella equi]